MSDISRLIYSFPPEKRSAVSDAAYERQIREYVKAVERLSSDVFVSGAGGGEDMLETLDPSVNTVPYILALLIRIRSLAVDDGAFRPGGPLWQKTVTFLEGFNVVQIRYTGSLWRDLLHAVEASARTHDALPEALPLIKTAMARLDPTLSVFTSVHLQFLRLCMETQSYRYATSVLDHDVLSFPTTATQGIEQPVRSSTKLHSSEYITIQSDLSGEISAGDVQEYLVLGAMAYIGIGNYARARLLLEHVLVSPTNNTATGLMLEAYRKWVLVALLTTGKLSPSSVPYAGNTYALRIVRSASKAYDSVATIFQRRDKKRLAEEIEAGAELWEEHGNKGLMDLVLQAVTRFWVADLQSIYTAIPISQVAAWLSQEPGDVESYIQSLIQSGNLTATIDKPSSTSITSSANKSLSTTPSTLQSKTPPSSTSPTTAKTVPSSSSSNNNIITSSVLRFYSEDDSVGPFAKTEKERYEALAAQMERTNALAEQVKVAEAKLTLTREYVEFLRRKRTHRNSVGEGVGRGTGGAGGAGVGDEMLVDGGGAGGGGGSSMWGGDDGIADAGGTGMNEDDYDDDEEEEEEEEDGDDTMDDMR